MSKKFPGFPKEPATNYWPYPKVLNGFWHLMTGSEQKILDYILRHTWGFKKTQDTISYKQFVKGIRKKDGEWLDKGTGLTEPTVSSAIKGLVKKKFVEAIKRREKGKQSITEYRLKFLKSENVPDRLKVSNSENFSDNKRDITIKDNNKRTDRKKRGFSKLDELLGRKKKRYAAYEWQDHALRIWNKIGYKNSPPKPWFRLFKLAYQKNQVGILKATIADVIDADVDNKEKYFYWKFYDLLKKKQK